MTGRVVYEARRVRVRLGSDGLPAVIGGVAVEAVREEWLVEDRWWTQRPLGRRYFELALSDGANVVVFCEIATGRWFRQRG